LDSPRKSNHIDNLRKSTSMAILHKQTITIDCKNHEECRMKIVRQIALYGECKLTTADITVKTIGTIKVTIIQTFAYQNII